LERCKTELLSLHQERGSHKDCVCGGEAQNKEKAEMIRSLEMQASNYSLPKLRSIILFPQLNDTKQERDILTEGNADLKERLHEAKEALETLTDEREAIKSLEIRTEEMVEMEEKVQNICPSPRCGH
jgi:hypothetical protein